MRRALLPLLGLVFALPLSVVLVQTYGHAASLFAFAEPPGLMEGCGDVPEAVALAEELRDRGLRIQRYMEAVDNRERDLASAEARLRARLVELKAMKASLRSGEVNRSSALQTDIDRLVAVYDQMKPAEAAAVLTNLPADFAAEILMRVQPETGARIIAAVEPSQAAVLTTHMGARSVRNR
ncbi:MAG: MotE family protein [Paracoccus sp. (in: a-proteobacteria)]